MTVQILSADSPRPVSPPGDNTKRGRFHMKRFVALCLCLMLLVPAAAQAKIEFPTAAQIFLDVLEKYLSVERLATVDADTIGDVEIHTYSFDADDHYAIVFPDDEDETKYNALFNYGGPTAIWADMGKEDVALFLMGVATAYEQLNDGFTGDNFKIWVQMGEVKDGLYINSPELAEKMLNVFQEKLS